MGPCAAEDKEADDQKVANGEDTGKVKNNNHVESDNLSSKENVGGCCQGVNGVSCCRSASLEQNKEIEETPETHKKGIKICSNWPQLQQRDIRTAVGVLGAVAVVVVAFKLYRRAA